jgi:FkbM family methyltransferase
MYPDADIYCFEPASARLNSLQAFTDAMSVQMVPTALGDVNGYKQLQLAKHGVCNSLFPSQPGPFEHLQGFVGVETVSVTRLDDWCTLAHVDPASIGYIYLDIQGAELMALKGSPVVLRHAQLVTLEVAFKPMYKDAPLHPDIDLYMRAMGFTCCLLLAASIAPDVYGDAWYIRRGDAKQ